MCVCVGGWVSVCAPIPWTLQPALLGNHQTWHFSCSARTSSVYLQQTQHEKPPLQCIHLLCIISSLATGHLFSSTNHCLGSPMKQEFGADNQWKSSIEQPAHVNNIVQSCSVCTQTLPFCAYSILWGALTTSMPVNLLCSTSELWDHLYIQTQEVNLTFTGNQYCLSNHPQLHITQIKS